MFIYFARATNNITVYYHQDPQYRKRFFESFAKDNEFDPLVAENWYNITKKQILAEKVLWSNWHCEVNVCSGRSQRYRVLLRIFESTDFAIS